MAKEEMLEFPGVVMELLPNATFRVELENNHMDTSNNCVLAVVRQIRFKERTRFGSGGAFDGSVRFL